MQAIKPLARSTARPGADSELGGFGGLFDLKAAGYRDPLLVSATDGVGTKLKLAVAAGNHETVGIDLVAMCVNDLIVQGAEPLFFLDYFATSQLNEEIAEAVVRGIAWACKQTGCALIGGETAEMPGLYAPGDYDLAGFAVGAVERGGLLDGGAIKAGDLVLGLASDGLHSNGFSLVRKIIAEQGFALDDEAPFDPGQTLARALLKPTRLYVRPCLDALHSGQIHGLAHITGGGLIENLPRILPDGLGVRLAQTNRTLPSVFAWLAQEGKIPVGELLRTFNCGIGMAVVVAAEAADQVARRFEELGETVYPIGEVVPVTEGSDRMDSAALGKAWEL